MLTTFLQQIDRSKILLYFHFNFHATFTSKFKNKWNTMPTSALMVQWFGHASQLTLTTGNDIIWTGNGSLQLMENE